MGTVYCGEDSTLHRPVAIKVLKPELASDSQLVSRFRAEARILASLRHPNLVHIYSFGTEKGMVYFVMELVDGMPISELIIRSQEAGEPIDTDVVAAIAEEIADALDEIHAVGVIHRDVKPANILLDQVRGRAVLVDVGVAIRFEEVGDAAGTPGFAAPESFVQGGEENPATDVYGLAATVYTMLTGTPPFRGTRLSELLDHQLHSKPVAPSLLRPSLSRGVDDVLLRALSPGPTARYRSAMAFAIALSKALSRDPEADVPLDLLDADTRGIDDEVSLD